MIDPFTALGTAAIGSIIGIVLSPMGLWYASTYAADKAITTANAEAESISAALQGGRVYNRESRLALAKLSTLDLPDRIRISRHLVNKYRRDVDITIRIATDSINNTIDEVEQQLNEIEREIQKNETRYLTNWRSSSIQKIVDNVQIQVEELAHQVDRLLQLILLQKCNPIANFDETIQPA
jgi:hypothetical protein